MSRLCLDEYFSLFCGIIAISTARVNYVCHKKVNSGKFNCQLVVMFSPVRVLSQPTTHTFFYND